LRGSARQVSTFSSSVVVESFNAIRTYRFDSIVSMSSLGIVWNRLKDHPLSRVGPGLITGVADDDPSGIATYSQAGAQFGLNMLWTMPLVFPLMAAIQLMCADIGRVTGKGIAANIKTAFPPVVLRGVVLLLLVANTLNIAADIAAMGETAELVTGFDRHGMTVFFVVVTVLLQVFVPYHRYVFFLKWLTLSLLAYAAVLFTVHVPWGEVALRTVWPKFTPDSDAATLITGVFGTTISPYLFFWQASEEIEDMQREGGRPLIADSLAAGHELRRINWDTWSGMFYSDATAYFIILATAVTLHVAGVTDVETAAQAASALRPLAGDFAYILFALGILGVGLIGVPVLAGSAAYAFSEAMGWKWGECCDKRNCCCSAYGGDHSSGVQQVCHGPIHRKSTARRFRLDRHRYNGVGRSTDVHSRLVY
jgi:Mn2+/Fe2+ NRAMP family transporter